MLTEVIQKILVDDLEQLIKFWHFINTCKILNDAYISNQKITTKSFTFSTSRFKCSL